MSLERPSTKRVHVMRAFLLSDGGGEYKLTIIIRNCGPDSFEFPRVRAHCNGTIRLLRATDTIKRTPRKRRGRAPSGRDKTRYFSYYNEYVLLGDLKNEKKNILLLVLLV